MNRVWLAILLNALYITGCGQGLLSKAGWREIYGDDFNDGTPLSNKWYTNYGWGNFMVPTDSTGRARANNSANLNTTDWFTTYESATNAYNTLYKQDGVAHFKVKRMEPPIATMEKTGRDSTLNTFNYAGALLRSKYWDSSCADQVYACSPEYTLARNGMMYGMFEARCKLPATDENNMGLYPAFWLWGFAEIDVFEFNTAKPKEIFSTNHWNTNYRCWTGEPRHCSAFYKYRDGENFNDGNFHTYTLVWTPKEISWFFDGRLYRTERQAERLLNDCGYFLMDLIIGVGLNWPNQGMNPTSEMLVDYVKVYKPADKDNNYSYLQAGGTNADTIVVHNFEALGIGGDRMSLAMKEGKLYYRPNKSSGLGFYTLKGNSAGQHYITGINDLKGGPVYDAVTGYLAYRTRRNTINYSYNGNTYTTALKDCRGEIICAGKWLAYQGSKGKIWIADSKNPGDAPVAVEANCLGGLIYSSFANAIYYCGINHRLYRVNLNGALNALGVTETGNVTTGITINPVNGTVNYIGTEGHIWEYNPQKDTTGPRDLFTQGGAYRAYKYLTWDSAGKRLYYMDSHKRPAYCFSDNPGAADAHFYTTLMQFNNFYNAPLAPAEKAWVGGAIIPSLNGGVYYPGIDGRLYECLPAAVIKVPESPCDNNNAPGTIY